MHAIGSIIGAFFISWAIRAFIQDMTAQAVREAEQRAEQRRRWGY